MSLSLHRLLNSARVYTLTALEVAVLGAGSDLVSADPAASRSADADEGPPAATGRHRAAVPEVIGVSGTSEARR